MSKEDVVGVDGSGALRGVSLSSLPAPIRSSSNCNVITLQDIHKIRAKYILQLYNLRSFITSCFQPILLNISRKLTPS